MRPYAQITNLVRLRDLPARSGVSKEGIAASVGFLGRKGYAVSGPDPSGRGKVVLDDPAANLPRYPMVLHRGGYPDGS